MIKPFKTKLLRDQYLYGASTQFFAPVMARIKTAFDEWDVFEEHERTVIAKLLPAMLDPKAIIPFIEYYFRSLQKREIDRHDWQATQLLKTSQMGAGEFSQSKKFSEEGRTAPKPVGTHFLTSAEYQTAYDYVTVQHPELLPATFLIKDCMNAYLDSLDIALADTEEPKLTDMTSALILNAAREKLNGGVVSDPFFQEFLPIFAEKLATDGREFLSPPSVSEGLRPFFQKNSAMQGLDDDKGNPRTIYCPFKKVMGQVINAKLDWNESGKVKLQEGIEPAGLLKFSIRFLEKHGVFTPSPAEQPKPSQ